MRLKAWISLGISVGGTYYSSFSNRVDDHNNGAPLANEAVYYCIVQTNSHILDPEYSRSLYIVHAIKLWPNDIGIMEPRAWCLLKERSGSRSP